MPSSNQCLREESMVKGVVAGLTPITSLHSMGDSSGLPSVSIVHSRSVDILLHWRLPASKNSGFSHGCFHVICVDVLAIRFSLGHGYRTNDICTGGSHSHQGADMPRLQMLMGSTEAVEECFGPPCTLR
eukprot:Protomagalhaensia_sp_Gyna_25__2197@NODE_2197_length_1228_cov_186_121951_g1818_i0_p2_GENE_NODE_2197_length_1228_cov_186_121951_g1818_i0NODE_2197_length_1228_cov_186_121951_g1818_i0_p2_ORF_typecomplete_len129_score2_64_NODE_2197_length_1228_cov_186_121951_g1818_i05391